MNFVHAREYLNCGQSVRVDCDTQCNVMLTDDYNFENYRSGRQFTYFGGHRTHFPITLTPPHAGHWNVTIDLAGRSANIKYSITVAG